MKVLSSIVALACCSVVFGDMTNDDEVVAACDKTPKKNKSVQSCPTATKKGKAADMSFYQGEMLTDNRYPPAYNAPAKIELHDAHCKWPDNIFFDASFIYWYAAQDGMGIAMSGDVSGAGPTLHDLVFNKQSVSLTQPFSYNPGFKLGLGAGVGEWEVHVGYTWVRQKTSMSSNAPTDETIGAPNIPIWEINSWFAQSVPGSTSFISATHVHSSWRMGLDQIDLTAGRPYYQSKNSTISPYGGARALWIRQSLRIGATVPALATTGTLASQPIYSHNNTHSWALGPVVGATGHCLLGKGFRLNGDAGASILFTQYTKLSHSEDSLITGTTPTAFKALQTNYNCVRPTMNLGLGLGWGMYFYDAGYHIDFAADYDFNVFWNQNMMRTFAEEFAISSSPSNDLFLHGLTFTTRFDF